MSKFCLCYRPADEKYPTRPETWTTFLMDRSVVDDPSNPDPSIQQILPYVTITRTVADEQNQERLQALTYSRGKQTTEGRLIDRRSLGFGGHIDTLPEGGFIEHIVQEAERELVEELGMKVNRKALYASVTQSLRTDRLISIKDRSPVDSVHTALAIQLDMDQHPGNEELIAEAGHVEDLRWVDVQEFTDSDIQQYETWSQMLIAWLRGVLEQYQEGLKQSQELMYKYQARQAQEQQRQMRVAQAHQAPSADQHETVLLVPADFSPTELKVVVSNPSNLAIRCLSLSDDGNIRLAVVPLLLSPAIVRETVTIGDGDKILTFHLQLDRTAQEGKGDIVTEVSVLDVDDVTRESAFDESRDEVFLSRISSRLLNAGSSGVIEGLVLMEESTALQKPDDGFSNVRCECWVDPENERFNVRVREGLDQENICLGRHQLVYVRDQSKTTLELLTFVDGYGQIQTVATNVSKFPYVTQADIDWINEQPQPDGRLRLAPLWKTSDSPVNWYTNDPEHLVIEYENWRCSEVCDIVVYPVSEALAPDAFIRAVYRNQTLTYRLALREDRMALMVTSVNVGEKVEEDVSGRHRSIGCQNEWLARVGTIKIFNEHEDNEDLWIYPHSSPPGIFEKIYLDYHRGRSILRPRTDAPDGAAYCLVANRFNEPVLDLTMRVMTNREGKRIFWITRIDEGL